MKKNEKVKYLIEKDEIELRKHGAEKKKKGSTISSVAIFFCYKATWV